MPSTAPHVQSSCPGSEVKGCGQSATGSYGPVMSSPPFCPGTAGNAESGFACACTRCILVSTNKPATNPAAVITMSATVTARFRMDFPFQIFGVCTAEEYYVATTDWSQDLAVGCPVLGAFPRAGILDCDSESNGSRAWNESEERKIKLPT